MDKLIVALGPAFVAGFAVQRLLELIDSFFVDPEAYKKWKKLILGLVSFVIGGALAYGLGLSVLRPLGATSAGLWDVFVTALVISAGTDGFNTILKFLGYAKEDKKTDAAGKSKENLKPALEELARAV